MEVDDMKLVKEVRLHRILYASGCVGHRSKLERAKAWAAISSALKIPDSVCQARWRVIRDRYVRSLTKRFSTTVGKTLDTEKYVKLFKHMRFLNEHIKFRNRVYSTTSSVSQHCNEEENDFEMADEDCVQTSNDTLFEEFLKQSTASASTSKPSEEVKNRFINFLDIIETIVDQQINDSPTLNDSNQIFFEMVRTKLKELPLDEQEDMKLQILSVIFTAVKNEKKLQSN